MSPMLRVNFNTKKEMEAMELLKTDPICALGVLFSKEMTSFLFPKLFHILHFMIHPMNHK